VTARENEPRVPAVGSALPLPHRIQVPLLRHIVGPLRRRFWKVEPNPPPLTAEEILHRLVTMPVSNWTYEFEPGVRHLGPMSQDFAAAFGLGRTNRMVDMVDANGVAVAAIQVLHRRIEVLEKEVARLRAGEGSPGSGEC